MQAETTEPAGGVVVVDELLLHLAVGEIARELQDEQTQAALVPGLATALVRIEVVERHRESADVDDAITIAKRMNHWNQILQSEQRFRLLANGVHGGLISSSVDS